MLNILKVVQCINIKYYESYTESVIHFLTTDETDVLSYFSFFIFFYRIGCDYSNCVYQMLIKILINRLSVFTLSQIISAENKYNCVFYILYGRVTVYYYQLLMKQNHIFIIIMFLDIKLCHFIIIFFKSESLQTCRLVGRPILIIVVQYAETAQIAYKNYYFIIIHSTSTIKSNKKTAYFVVTVRYKR